MDETHYMRRVEIHPDGFEKWVCFDCGRTFLLHWPPGLRRIVIIDGDIEVIHTGIATDKLFSGKLNFDVYALPLDWIDKIEKEITDDKR